MKKQMKTKNKAQKWHDQLRRLSLKLVNNFLYHILQFKMMKRKDDEKNENTDMWKLLKI